MPKESTIQHYTSSTTGNTPAAVDLASGELAINTADEKVFYKNHVGTVLSLSQTKDLSGAFAASSRVVSSFNGLTGAVTLTGDGGSSLVLGNNVTTNRVATTSVTGVASFNATRFSVSAAGAVDLATAYQATGDTVQAGSFINIGAGKTINNIGVHSIDGATGAITNVARTNVAQSFSGLQTFTNGISGAGATFASVVSVGELLARTVGGDEGGELKLGLAATNTTLTGTTVTVDVYQNKLRFFESGGNNRGYFMDLSTASNGVGSQLATSTPYSPPLATTSITGVASFNNVHFTVDTTGHVKLAAAYQVTGQTIVAGNNISTTTSGNTVTINVTAGGASNAIQFNSNGTLTGNSNFTYNPTTGETVITVSGSARTISLLPGPQSYISSNGNSELNIIAGNSGINTVRLGDVDVNGNGTKVEINDGSADITLNADNGVGAGTINLNSGSSIVLNANTVQGNGGLTNAGWLTVGGGATFNSNVTIRGNASLGDAATDTTTIYGTKIINEGVFSNGSLRTANINFANGQVQTLTGVGTGATGTTAIFFTGAPSTGAASVTMIITNGGTMTGAGMTAWGGNIKWPAGIKPVLTSSGVDVVSFVTPDAGTTIYGFVGGLNFL